MFILVQEHADIGVVAVFAGSSAARTPVVTDQWFSVLLSAVFTQS